MNVSSVTSRYGWVGAVDRFLSSWTPGSYYPSTKLANVRRPLWGAAARLLQAAARRRAASSRRAALLQGAPA